jgi:N-acyl-D-amino-acid deacylase
MGPMGQTYHWREDYEPALEDSVTNIAAAQGREELEVAYDFMAMASDGSEGAGCLWRPVFANRADGTYNPSLEGVHKTFMDNDHAVPGIADAGAHGTMLTDAVSNTTLLAHYVRDRESHMPIETAVMKSTLAAAQIYGLSDRGVLAPGMKADINVFQLENLRVFQPEYVNDLPEDAPRW